MIIWKQINFPVVPTGATAGPGGEIENLVDPLKSTINLTNLTYYRAEWNLVLFNFWDFSRDVKFSQCTNVWPYELQKWTKAVLNCYKFQWLNKRWKKKKIITALLLTRRFGSSDLILINIDKTKVKIL